MTLMQIVHGIAKVRNDLYSIADIPAPASVDEVVAARNRAEKLAQRLSELEHEIMRVRDMRRATRLARFMKPTA